VGNTRGQQMVRKTKEEKRIEAATEAAFNLHGKNIQFNVMDLGKIYNAGVNAGKAGQSIEDAVKAAITQYKQS
jgi:metal-sulfur cluster biosynthetic enzyme